MVAVRQAPADLAALYSAHPSRVEIVEVPEVHVVAVVGEGSPDGDAFAAAVGALYAVSYAVRAALKRRDGAAPPVMPLEAQWWVDGGAALWRHVDRGSWRWRAMILQPDSAAGGLVAAAIGEARDRGVPAAERVREVTWQEGLAAQLLHVGPYADEWRSVQRLHAAIADSGLRARGRHHEIYLGDPRRTAPDRLRTILRQPVEPA